MKLKQTIAGVVSTALTAAMFVAPVVASVQIEDKKITSESAHCLALNVYYEARGSNLADQASVADVVLNRVQDTRYPSTICQFSWYCDGKADDPQDEDRWFEAQMIAWNMLEHNQFRGITEGSTHYHATYVNPRWASSLQMVGRIGAHIYYRWER
jgi:spore germination cell wall hydrolase CwlJ-like protein